MALGAAPNAEMATLALRDWQNLPRPARVIGVNVAGEAARMRVETQLARWRVHADWLSAGARRAASPIGRTALRTTRRRPLGRLVAARQRAVPASVPPAAIVVNAGTAVTIDALDAEGVFRGGVILPGLRLMLRALAEKTAALKVAPGRYPDFPINTADAMYSGALRRPSTARSSRRAMRLKTEAAAKSKCFIAGGAASEIRRAFEPRRGRG